MLAHPSQYLQAPAILAWTEIPSAYYAQEPRRRSYERALADHTALLSARGLVRRLDEAVLSRLDRHLVEHADLLLVNSRFSAEAIYRAYGVTARFVPLGVDGDVFRTRSVQRQRRVLSVGGLEPHKGHELAIETLARVPVAKRPSLLIIHGRGEIGRQQSLATCASRAGVGLELRHGISDVALARLYQESLATLCMSRLEPFGLTSLESLACGTPVLALAEGGFREVVDHGTNGFLVEPSPSAAAHALVKILAGELVATAEDLRASVWPRWSWAATACSTERSLRELVVPSAQLV